MSLDPYVQRFLERLSALKPPSALSLSVAERRSALAHILDFAGPSLPVVASHDHIVPGPAGPLAMRLYTPEIVEDGLLPGLVYFHGGGLVAGSLDTHDGICRELTRSSGCRVLGVNYRLAPEHRFPAALEDGCAAVRYVAGHACKFAIDERRLGVCGDSAGATLAAAVCQQLARAGHNCLALQVLLCPITDFAARSVSRRELSHGYLLDEATLEHDLRYYLGTEALATDPRVSPLRATKLTGLPPAIIHTAEYDLVRDEGRIYAKRLREAGVATSYTCHPGMIHLFYGMGGIIPYAAKAWEEIGAQIRTQFTMN